MPSFLLQQQDPLSVNPEQLAAGPEPTFDEIREAAFEDARRAELSTGSFQSLKDVWSPIVEEVEQKSGQSYHNPAWVQDVPEYYQKRVQSLIDEVKANPDKYPDLQDIDTRDFREEAKTVTREGRDELQKLLNRSTDSWLDNTAAEMVGGFQAFFQDPLFYATLPLGLIGAEARSVLGLATREAIIGAGTEAALQPSVAKWYKELGYDYTYEDFVQRVALGGAFGATFAVGFSGIGKGITLTAEQAQKGLEAFRKAGYKDTPNMKAAENLADIGENIEADNPLVSPVRRELDEAQAKLEESSAEMQARIDALGLDDLERAAAKDSDLEHIERSIAADEAVKANEAPRMSAEPNAPIRDEVLQTMGYQVHAARDFSPDELQVDPDLFQYKSGGDEFGVTEALQGISTWDQVRAGTALVYEFADGRKYIADGHQRLGLAKRIAAQDPSQKPMLHAYVLREVDGITPSEARVIASLKNIVEGTGSAIDAAKVLRVSPDKIDQMNLPPTSALVRQAKDLVNLSDDVFMAVVNGVVSPNHAAVIGRLVPEDADMQQAAMSVLAKADPANEFQAEAMVRQVRAAGYERVVQDGLFGEESFAESFVIERAKILDQAQKQIRRDKAAFQNLVSNANRLEQEGNVLQKTNNERRVTNEAQTLAVLQALANARGPLSDALNAAARQARESGGYAEPTRGFLDAVRRAADEGDFDRLTAGDVGRTFDDSPQSSFKQDEAEPSLEGFEEPAGIAAQQQADQLFADIQASVAAASRELDEDAYIRLINPENIRIADDARPRLFSADMEGMIPQEKINQENFITRTDNGISYYKDQNNIFAVYSDMEGDVVVGYSIRTDEGTELAVAQDFQNQGIGSELSYLYRSQDPKAYSGGLTAAGEAIARKTFRRLANIELKNDPLLYFEKTEDSIDLPVSQLVPVRARPEGIFNSKVFMAQAAGGTRTKRQPIEVRDMGDGTYRLWDGNSTYAVAVEAGFSTIPARVLTPEEYKAAAQAKNKERILDPQGKEKKRIVTVQDGEEAVMAQFVSEMKLRQNLESFDDMMVRGERNHNELNQAAAEIARDLGLDFKVAPVKTAESAMRKLRDKYMFNPEIHNEADFISKMTDIARAGVIISKPEDVDNFLKALNKKYHVIDEGFAFTPAGYFDAKAIIVMGDGQLAEFQFWPPGMLPAKEAADLTPFGYARTFVDDGEIKEFKGGHKLYEIERDATLPDEVRAKATLDMRKLYGAVIDELPASFDSMLLAMGKSRKSAPSKMPKDSASASDISGERSSISMAEGEPGPAQMPARSFQTNADRLSSEIAASDEPSTLKNLTNNTSELSVTDLVTTSNLDEPIPVGRSIQDEFGETSVETQTLREMQAEFETDQRILDRFEGCVK